VTNVLFADAPVSFSTIKPEYSNLLTYAIPALTTATGGEKGGAISEYRGDFQAIDMNSKKNDSTWPISRDSQWFHSDIKDVAFPFVAPIVYEIVNRGGLK